MVGNSMRSSDWICPSCKTMQFAQNVRCRSCAHAKPTLNTMGQACWAYYPLADQRMKCEGERHCPECHGIIHRSHSECLGCRERRLQAEQQAMTGPALLALPAGARRLALLTAPAASSAPKTAFESLCDKYAGVAPEDVLEDLEKLKAGQPQQEEAEDTPEAKAEREELKRRLAEANEKQLAEARVRAQQLSGERERKRGAAAAHIQAMLDADAREAPPEAAAGEEGSAAEEVEAAAPSSKRSAAEEEERREKRAKLRQQQEEEEQERRKRQRERRQQRTVVLEG